MVCLVVTACGGSGDDTSGAAPATTTTSSATTAAASPACADAAALKASVAELDQLDPPSAGKAGIQAALDKVSTNLMALKTSAKSQWGSQLAELDGAVKPSRRSSPGSTATAWSRPCRQSSATCSGSIPPGRRYISAALGRLKVQAAATNVAHVVASVVKPAAGDWRRKRRWLHGPVRARRGAAVLRRRRQPVPTAAVGGASRRGGELSRGRREGCHDEARALRWQ